jgi:LPS-assembly protein
LIRRFALAVALAALAGPALCAEAPADLSADTTTYDEATGETILKGGARLVDTGLLMTADEIRFNQRTQIAVARGNVVLTRIGDRMLADEATFNRANGNFTALNLRIGRFPFYIEGPSAEGNQIEVKIHDATVTYGEPGRWQPSIKAKLITYSPGHYLRISSANVGIGNYRPVPITSMAQDLAHQTSFGSITLDGGYRSSLGPYVDAALHLPVETGFTAGPDLGLYAYRGLMVGPVANYDITSGDDSTQGFLKSGYIYDYGRRNTDILNNPVPPNRAFVEWQHEQQVTPELSVDGDINWSTDSEVIRDFHAKEFIPVQEPDNFLEAVYAGPDYLASVFTRFQPNAFYPVQERLPEIRFDLLPTAVGGGFYVRFDSSVAHLEENPPDGGSHLESDRLDAFVGVSRPFTYKGIVDFTPVAGGRVTEYWDTSGAENPGGRGRALGELGFDADLKMSGVFNYDSELLGINGLRHLVTPTLSYRYIPDADKSADWIPPIDRYTFTTYLPVLELGDMRALDQLQAENVLRVGLNNTLQTRDKEYGSRDLMTFDVEDDIRFQRAPGETDFSDLYAVVTMTPAPWLDLRVEDSVTSNEFAQRASDATITFKAANYWSAGFGLGYLSNNYGGTYTLPGLGTFPIVGLSTYHVEGRYRLNEEYELFARADYDAQNHIFVDQFYGFSQRVANTWVIEYAVHLSQGPNKTGDHFGLTANINLLRF